MKFSVLMSVYQKENPDFLRKSLNSVLIEQNHKPDELVLVEDGPLTEELYQTIQDFKETFPEMKVLPLKENVGLGEALHRGVEACSYDWIARMDTDDIATPDRFQQQVDYIEQHPQLDVLGGNIIEFDTEPDQIVAEKQMPLSHEEIIKRLQRRNPFCHMTVFFKKSSVLKAGNYKPLHAYEKKPDRADCQLESGQYFFAVTWYVEPRAILSKYVDDSCFCGNAYLDKSVHL